MPESNPDGRSLPGPRNEDYEGPCRARITKEDLLRFGTTQGCPGCIGANRGGTSANHRDECHTRIEKALRDSGSRKVKGASKRMDEALPKQLEKGDAKNNQEKQNEDDKAIEEKMEDVFEELFGEPIKGS